MASKWFGRAACSRGTKSRSRARSGLLANAWQHELRLIAFFASNQGLHGPAADLLALVDAEWIAVEKVLRPDDVLVVQVDNPEIGEVPRSDIASPNYAKSKGSVVVRHRLDCRQLPAVV